MITCRASMGSVGLGGCSQAHADAIGPCTRCRMDGGSMGMELRSLADLVDALGREADAPALIGHRAKGSETWTRGELADRVQALAAGLRRDGVAPGDIVGLLAPNRPSWVLAFLAIVRAGAVAMPFNEQVTAGELGRILAHSGCRRVFTTAGFVKTFADLEPSGDTPAPALILLDGEGKDPQAASSTAVTGWEALARDGGGELPEVDPASLAVLTYTSGTTGTPKGVPLSHANIAANIRALLQERLAGPGDRALLPLPLHHAYPLTVGLLTGLAAGAAVVLPSGITGPEIARALTESRCTIMVAVPRLYEAMLAGIERRLAGRLVRPAFERLLALSIVLRARFGWQLGRRLFWPLHRRLGPALRMLASGGSRLDPEVARRLEGFGWEVLTGYGLTETAPILTFNPPGRARLETAGIPVEGVELRIAPPEEQGPGRRAGRGRPGRDPGARAQRVRGLLAQSRGDRRSLHRGRLFPHGRPRRARRGRLSAHRRPQQGIDRARRRQEHLPRRGRAGLRREPADPRDRGARAGWPPGRRDRARDRAAARRQGGSPPAAARRDRAALAPARVLPAARRLRDHARALAAHPDRQAAPPSAGRDVRARQGRRRGSRAQGRALGEGPGIARIRPSSRRSGSGSRSASRPSP